MHAYRRFVVGVFLIGFSFPVAVAQSPPKALTVTKVEDTADGACDADCSLREAVIAANSRPGEDRIMVPSGTYTLTIPDSENPDEQSGDLDLMDDVVIEGLGEAPRIMAAVSGRVFEIHGNELAVDATLVNLVVAEGDAGGEQGGGILAGHGSVLRLSGVTVESNRASKGGGIFASRATLTLEDTRVVSNEVENGDGAGLMAELSDVEIRDSLFRDNIVKVELDQIEPISPPPLIGGRGGGVAIDNSGRKGTSTPQHSTRVFRSSFVNNSAFEGGAFFGLFPSLHLSNVTLHGNQALLSGAAIGIGRFDADSAVEVIHGTITDNSEGQCETGSNFAIRLANTILASNAPANCCQQYLSLGGNLADDDCFFIDRDDDLVNTDPQLEDLQEAVSLDGATTIRALRGNSPAIDAAREAICLGLDPGNRRRDQRGASRPLDFDGDGQAACDIGAFEALPRQPDRVDLSAPPALELANPLGGYAMIGSPLEEVPPPSQFLVEQLGPPSPFRWRLLRFDPGENRYRELGADGGPLDDPFFDFGQGRGFWLITANGLSATIPGTPRDASGEPFIIRLEPAPGWQQVTTPFNFQLDWRNCLVDLLPDGASPQLMAFDSGMGGGVAGYVPAAEMSPGEGYWFCLTEQHLQAQDLDPFLLVSPLCAATDPVPPAPDLRSNERRLGKRQLEAGWELRLSLTQDGLGDIHNRIGARAGAEDGFDRHDLREPPMIHGLALYFERPQWDAHLPLFSSDIRALGNDGRRKGAQGEMRWAFKVYTQEMSREVLLSWQWSGLRPPDLVLIDHGAGRLIDLKQKRQYGFLPGPEANRRFEIIRPAEGSSERR